MSQAAPRVASGFNPLSRAFREDPYSHYRALRERGEVQRSAFGGFVLLGYDDIYSLLTGRSASSDPRALARSSPFRSLRGDANGVLARQRESWIVFRDGAEHMRIRRLVVKAFTRGAVDRLLPRIEQLVDELLTPMLEAGQCDVIEDFAHPLPASVICELLGIPEDARIRCRDWSIDITPSFDIIPSAKLMPRAAKALEEFVAYVGDLAEARRRVPQNGMLDALLAVEDDGERLTRDEVVANAIFLFGAGHETTTNLIGNGLLALLRAPEQLAMLRARPELIPGAVEELLRFDPPIQLVARTATAPLAIGGVEIPPGALVVALLGAGNRDPRRFVDPDRVDVTRTDVRALAFGAGAHFCAGANLARAEARIALARLLARTRSIRLLDERPPYRSSANLRGLEALRLELVPA
jgi:hypothetical protein